MHIIFYYNFFILIERLYLRPSLKDSGWQAVVEWF